MSVSYSKCNVKYCDVIFVDDGGDEILAKDKWDNELNICSECAKHFSEDDMVYCEEYGFSFLNKNLFKVKKGEIIFN